MFTGLVQTTGETLWLRRNESGTQLSLTAPGLRTRPRVGDSIAVNGCCLTVTSVNAERLSFDLLNETLERTNLGALKPGMSVNLEPSLAAGAALGGHFVQGHVDCRSEVLSMAAHGADHRLEVAVPVEFSHLVAYKGSIAINGVSLTVAEAHDTSAVCWIIPHTRSATNIGDMKEGTPVNLEFDILAKYVDRIVAHRRF